MINYIEQTLRSTITGLNFIERYGGYAVPITAKFPGEQQTYEKTFPISCYLSNAECFEQGKYRNLVPNDAYKSVAYLEEISSRPLTFSGAKSGLWGTTVTFRLVCWLNYKKLGLDDCRGSERFALALIKEVLNYGKQRTFDIDGCKGTIKVTSAKIREKFPNEVFGRYSYSNMQHLFMWPYDFFAVDFGANVVISGNCATNTVTLGSEIECLTNW